tara:strand:+ start:646 stop:837 length:192 start_codon:yes stop_codon:yes gene_type:complete
MARENNFLSYFPEMKNPRIESANNDEIGQFGIKQWVNQTILPRANRTESQGSLLILETTLYRK